MSSSSRLTKHTRRLHDDWPVVSMDSDDGAADKVTYVSTNTQDGRQFEAVSPPNSVHARKLAELALLVQSNERQSRSHQRPIATLETSRRRVAQIAPAASQTPAPQAQLQTYVTAPREARKVYEKNIVERQVPVTDYDSSLSDQARTLTTICTCSASSSPHQHVQSTAGNGQHEQYVSQAPEHTPAPPSSQVTYNSYSQDDITGTNQLGQQPEVYRYGTEQQTKYKVMTGTGEMRVSAPVGSSEAQAFDGAVERMSSKVS
jgi:hypothetical protein